MRRGKPLKKASWALLLLLGWWTGGTGYVLFAQQERKEAVAKWRDYAEVGFCGGTQLADVFVNDYYRFLLFASDPIWSYHGGLFLRYHMNSYAAVQLGASVSQQGYRQRYLRTQGFHQVRFDYLRVPWLMHLHYELKDFSLLTNVGVYYQYLMSFRTRSWGEARAENEDFYAFSWSRDSRHGYGIRYGGGGSWRSGVWGTVQIEGGMSFDLSDFLRDDRLNDSDIPFEARHFAYFLSLCYLLPPFSDGQ